MFQFNCGDLFCAFQALSLDKAAELDRINEKRRATGQAVPQATFLPTLYRQPALTEPEQQPEPYRRTNTVADAQRRVSIAGFIRRNSLNSGDAAPPSTGAQSSSATIDPFASMITRPHTAAALQGADVVFVPSTITEADCEDEDRQTLEDAVEEVLEGRGADELQRRTIVCDKDDEEKGSEMVPISETAEVIFCFYLIFREFYIALLCLAEISSN
jgi:hypothetical protein